MALKIFIVDDEQLIIDVLQAYLEREGYEVYSANNGAEALKKIKEQKPDFLILDLMLPDISGEEICRQVRGFSNMPILMLTAKTAEEDRIQGIVIGADDYVTKPFSPREVVVRVQAIANVGSTSDSTIPHIYIEVRINKKKKNPLDYVR
jgi:DNA-binding response OmpR family regulator